MAIHWRTAQHQQLMPNAPQVDTFHIIMNEILFDIKACLSTLLLGNNYLLQKHWQNQRVAESRTNQTLNCGP